MMSKFRDIKSNFRVIKSKFQLFSRNFDLLCRNFEIVSRNFEIPSNRNKSICGPNAPSYAMDLTRTDIKQQNKNVNRHVCFRTCQQIHDENKK